ncbi:PfkB family carbohydrate kinase [Niveispirillum fermenti]|uniref:PfkB family carbohydrate kinase n=1 Tax=Niveispirillum fermenti TaxID=1233113 RepID=UPI003A86989E
MSGRIVCFGELLMRLTAPGRELLLQSPRLDITFGGAEANVAVSLARFGWDAAVVSTLPDNAIGQACRGELRRHGVDTRGIQMQHGRMGLYFLTVGAMQRPSEIIYDRAGSAFAVADAGGYDWSRLLEGAGWLHIGGITPAVSANAETAVIAAAQAAKAAGVKVSFDCNYRAKLWSDRGGDAPAVFARLAACADLMFGNERDIALILGADFHTLALSERFLAAAELAFRTWPGLQRLASTIRTHFDVDHQELTGRIATRDHRVHYSRTYKLNGIVDRIGGGDAFAAGLIHGIDHGMATDAAINFAAAAAALKHAVPGDANLVSTADVMSLVNEEGLDVKR